MSRVKQNSSFLLSRQSGRAQQGGQVKGSYNQLVSEQLKASVLPANPNLSGSSVIFRSEQKLWIYNAQQPNTVNEVLTPTGQPNGGLSATPADISFFSNRFFTQWKLVSTSTGFDRLSVYSFSATPFTLSFIQNINLPSSIGFGIFAKDISTLIVNTGDPATNGSCFCELSIVSYSNPIFGPQKFCLAQNRQILSFFLTTNNKLISFNKSGTTNPTYWITQHNYSNGNQEYDIQFTEANNTTTGVIFESNGNIYVGVENGKIYNVLTVFPYTQTLITTISMIDNISPSPFYGSAQHRNTLFTSLGISPTQTPTSTVTRTQTPTPTKTKTQTPTVTKTKTQTPTVTKTKTQTPTVTKTKTPTPTPTKTKTPTPSVTKTQTQTPSVTKTQTPTPSVTPTVSTSPNWVECLRASSECTSPSYGFVDAIIIGTVYGRNSYQITFPNNAFTLSWNGVDAWVGYSGATPITKLVQDIPIPVGAFGQWVPFDDNSPASCISQDTKFYTDLSCVTPTPTSSVTPTVTPSSVTPTPTPTKGGTPTPTPTSTNTQTPTNTKTQTPSSTVTLTRTNTPTNPCKSYNLYGGYGGSSQTIFQYINCSGVLQQISVNMFNSYLAQYGSYLCALSVSATSTSGLGYTINVMNNNCVHVSPTPTSSVTKTPTPTKTSTPTITPTSTKSTTLGISTTISEPGYSIQDGVVSSNPRIFAFGKTGSTATTFVYTAQTPYSLVTSFSSLLTATTTTTEITDTYAYKAVDGEYLVEVIELSNYSASTLTISGFNDSWLSSYDSSANKLAIMSIGGNKLFFVDTTNNSTSEFSLSGGGYGYKGGITNDGGGKFYIVGNVGKLSVIDSGPTQVTYDISGTGEYQKITWDSTNSQLFIYSRDFIYVYGNSGSLINTINISSYSGDGQAATASIIYNPDNDRVYVAFADVTNNLVVLKITTDTYQITSKNNYGITVGQSLKLKYNSNTGLVLTVNSSSFYLLQT